MKKEVNERLSELEAERHRIRDAMIAFLEGGGEVQKVPFGVSGEVFQINPGRKRFNSNEFKKKKVA